MLLGPFFLNFYTLSGIEDLHFINSLALAFIAFSAGGELKLSQLKRKLKSIFYLIGTVTSVVFLGVTLIVLALSNFVPFMKGFDLIGRLFIAAIFGVIAVARSPSSAIAIISETNAEGDYTDIILTVTIAMDVIIIMLFAIVMSLSGISFHTGSQIDILFILYLLIQIILALFLGFLLGKGIVFLLEKVKVEFPVVILAMGFLVTKFCHLLGEYLAASYEISLHLEPLLICMAAGFTVQNFSRHGDEFIQRMESVSLPIYIAFFAITGASINIEILKTGWVLGIVIVIARILMIQLGCYMGGKLSGDTPQIYRYTWLGFITQAGVSLGLLTEVARRFPEIGVPIQTILVASITVNQVLGPVAFKYALKRVGDVKPIRK
jgi:Kef-type K+ transport system membrane component KefB